MAHTSIFILKKFSIFELLFFLNTPVLHLQAQIRSFLWKIVLKICWCILCYLLDFDIWQNLRYDWTNLKLNTFDRIQGMIEPTWNWMTISCFGFLVNGVCHRKWHQFDICSKTCFLQVVFTTDIFSRFIFWDKIQILHHFKNMQLTCVQCRLAVLFLRKQHTILHMLALFYHQTSWWTAWDYKNPMQHS
jgi:hypothetical protein